MHILSVESLNQAAGGYTRVQFGPFTRVVYVNDGDPFDYLNQRNRELALTDEERAMIDEDPTLWYSLVGGFQPV